MFFRCSKLWQFLSLCVIQKEPNSRWNIFRSHTYRCVDWGALKPYHCFVINAGCCRCRDTEVCMQCSFSPISGVNGADPGLTSCFKVHCANMKMSGAPLKFIRISGSICTISIFVVAHDKWHLTYCWLFYKHINLL